MPPEPSAPNFVHLLVSLGLLAIEAGCLAFFIVMTCLSLRELRHTWRRALLVSLLLLLLSLPSVIMAFAYLDLSRFTQNQPPGMVPIIRVAAFVGVALIMLLFIPLRALYYHVAKVEWARVRGSWPDSLAGPPATRRRGMLVALGVGVFTIVVTDVAFHFLHVSEGQDMQQMEQLFPTLQTLPRSLLLLISSGYLASAAILEELIFRGGLLGWLLRITKNQALPAWTFILLVSLLWAMLHIPNTDHPFLKVSQIFLFGIALGAMARQWGLSSAIVGHLTLNLGAVLVALVFPHLH